MTVPIEISNNETLFGAYLAGLIDGDGYIKVKNSKDRIIPQHVIKIASDRSLIKLEELIKRHIRCAVHYENHNTKNAVNTCFYLSKESINFIKNKVYPNISISHKKDRLRNYFEMIDEPVRIRTGINR